MSFLLPNESHEYHFKDTIKCISLNPTNNFVAVLYDDSFEIRNYEDFEPTIVAKYQHNPIFTSKFGPLHWIKWVNETKISFGTYGGVAFISTFKERFSDPVIFITNSTISSATSFNNQLILCTADSDLLRLSESGILSRNSVGDLHSGIFNANIIQTTTMSCIVDAHPCHITNIDKLGRRGEKLRIKNFSYNNVTNFVSAFDSLFLSLNDGTVIYRNLSNPNDEIIQSSNNDKAIFLDYVEEHKVFLAIFSSGRIFVKNFFTNFTHECQIDLLRNSTHFIFSKQFPLLFFINESGNLCSIEFQQFRNQNVWSQSHYFTLFSDKSIQTVAGKLYPLLGSEGDLAWSTRGFIYKAKMILIDKISFCKIFQSKICVFCSSPDRFLIFNSETMEKETEMYFPHSVKGANSFQDRLIAYSNIKFSIIKVTDAPLHFGDEMLHWGSDRFFYIKTIFWETTIQSVQPFFDGSILVLDSAGNFGHMKNVYSYFVHNDKFLFVNTNKGCILLTENDRVRYINNALFANDEAYFQPQEKCEFKLPKFNGLLYLPDLFRRSVGQEWHDKLDADIKEVATDYPSILANAFAQSVVLKEPIDFYQSLDTSLFEMKLSQELRDILHGINALIEQEKYFDIFMKNGMTISHHFEKLGQLTVEKCMEIARKNADGEKGMVRFFATALEAAGYAKFAICVLIVADELQRAKCMLLIHEELVGQFRNFIEFEREY